MYFFQKNYPSNLTLNLLNLQNPSSNFLNWSPYISLKNIIWEGLFQGSNYFPLGYHSYMVKPQTPTYYCGQFALSLLKESTWKPLHFLYIYPT